MAVLLLVTPYRSLNGSLFRQTFSLIQSLGNLSGNLGSYGALAREICQKRSKIRIFPDLFPVSRERGRSLAMAVGGGGGAL
jgi:hypothetical protein